MQRRNPNEFYSFISKSIILVLLGSALVYIIGAIILIPVLLLLPIIAAIDYRVEDKEILGLNKERGRLVAEWMRVDKDFRSSNPSQDRAILFCRLNELEKQIDEVLAELRQAGEAKNNRKER